MPSLVSGDQGEIGSITSAGTMFRAGATGEVDLLACTIGCRWLAAKESDNEGTRRIAEAKPSAALAAQRAEILNDFSINSLRSFWQMPRQTNRW